VAHPCGSSTEGMQTEGDLRVRKYRRIAVFGIVLSSSGLGCGTTARTPFVSQADGRLNIEVINNGFEDATLHVIALGRRIRLGTATGATTATFMLPWDQSIEIHIEIDLLASRSCATRSIWADPGDTILLEIQQGLRDCGY
jgi:hypothetical protein